MGLDHEAIYKAYPSVVSINDTDSKILDASGNPVSVEQSKIDAARTTIDSDYAKVKYKDDRKPLYPSLGEFADAMYWNSKGDSTKLEEYYAACEKVKTDNPKPS
jgi:hypothetical protein|tara:strand:+ start:79 stop:390 length:312 start_codon:yes stop_codon:yes gene_type:complete